MPRPTKLTPEREQRLFAAIRAGNTRKAACAYAGISDDTLSNWSRRSSDFSDRLTRAEAESEVALVAIVRQAAQTDWRAAAHLLERRWPDTWGRREKVDIDLYVRERARELGLDEGQALSAVRERLRLVG